MKAVIDQILKKNIQITTDCIHRNSDLLIRAAQFISRRIAAGQKMMLFGNGGSAADAQHMAAEFVNRIRIKHPPLAAIALTTDTSVITSIGNDSSFNDIFATQITALGHPNDIAVGISTSGNSRNVVKAVKTAKALQIFTIAMTGSLGCELSEYADLVLPVQSYETARIQEAHIVMGHILCELVDQCLNLESTNSKNLT